MYNHNFKHLSITPFSCRSVALSLKKNWMQNLGATVHPAPSVKKTAIYGVQKIML